MWYYRLIIHDFHFRAVERLLNTFLLCRGHWVCQIWEPLAWIHHDLHPGMRGEPEFWNLWLPGTWTTSDLRWAWRPEMAVGSAAMMSSCPGNHPLCDHWVLVDVQERAPQSSTERHEGATRATEAGLGLHLALRPDSLPGVGHTTVSIYLWERICLWEWKIGLSPWTQSEEYRGQVRCDQCPAEADGSGRGLWRQYPPFLHSAIQLKLTEYLLDTKTHAPRYEGLGGIRPEPAL